MSDLEVVPSIEDDAPLYGTDRFSAPVPDEFQATADSTDTTVSPTEQFGPYDQPSAPTGSSAAEFSGKSSGGDVEDVASSWLGVPYLYGGNGRKGIDCSGFTRAVYKEVYGIDLPRISYQQANGGRRVSFNKAQAGDLIAWDNSSRNNGADHIAIYLGNGWIIESPRPGLKVRKRRLDMSGYDRQAWAVHYNERD